MSPSDAGSEPGSASESLSAEEPLGEPPAALARDEPPAAAAAESRSLVEARRRAEEKALVEKARRVREAQRREEEEERRRAEISERREEEAAQRREAERVEAEERVAAKDFSGFESDVSVSDGDVEIEHPRETDVSGSLSSETPALDASREQLALAQAEGAVWRSMASARSLLGALGSSASSLFGSAEAAPEAAPEAKADELPPLPPPPLETYPGDPPPPPADGDRYPSPPNHSARAPDSRRTSLDNEAELTASL